MIEEAIYFVFLLILQHLYQPIVLLGTLDILAQTLHFPYLQLHLQLLQIHPQTPLLTPTHPRQQILTEFIRYQRQLHLFPFMPIQLIIQLMKPTITFTIISHRRIQPLLRSLNNQLISPLFYSAPFRRFYRSELSVIGCCCVVGCFSGVELMIRFHLNKSFLNIELYNGRYGLYPTRIYPELYFVFTSGNFMRIYLESHKNAITKHNNHSLSHQSTLINLPSINCLSTYHQTTAYTYNLIIMSNMENENEYLNNESNSLPLEQQQQSLSAHSNNNTQDLYLYKQFIKDLQFVRYSQILNTQNSSTTEAISTMPAVRLSQGMGYLLEGSYLRLISRPEGLWNLKSFIDEGFIQRTKDIEHFIQLTQFCKK